MTPEERAMDLWERFSSLEHGVMGQVQFVVAIREAEAAARAEEREACAVLAETRWNHHRGYSAAGDLVKAGAMAIAEDIRARRESEAPDAA
jgi:hypothetical protein